MSVRISEALKAILPRTLKRGRKKRLAEFIVKFNKGTEEFTDKELVDAMDTLSYSSHRVSRLKDGRLVFKTVDGDLITGYIAKVLGWFESVTKGNHSIARKQNPSPKLLGIATKTIEYDLQCLGICPDQKLVERLVVSFIAGHTNSLYTQDKNSLLTAPWRLGVRSGFVYFYDSYLRMLSEPMQEILEELLTEAVCE